MFEIDCLGDMCPVPLLRLQAALKAKESEIVLVSDHSCVLQSITEFCKKSGITCVADEVANGVWQMHITA